MALQGMNPEKLLKRFSNARARRVLVEDHWQECSDYCSPNMEDVTIQSAEGEKKAQRILDNTAGTEAEALAGLLQGFLHSANERFFNYTTGDEELDKRDAVRKWLEKTSDTIWKVMQSSNFLTASFEKFLNDVVYGTATMAVEEDKDLIARFTTRAVREIWIEEDFRGFVNVHYRYYDESVTNLIEQFGEKNLPQKVLDCYKSQKDEKFKVLHAIYPSWMVKGNERSVFKYISQYVLEKTKEDIAVEGFRESVFVTDRWSKNAGELYGRSPGMKALPEAKMLNAMMYTTLSGAQKVVDPPLQAPDDGFVHPLVTAPAGMNYYRAGSQDRIEPIFNDSRVDFGIQLVELQQAKIKKCFFTDKLRLPENTVTTNQMSATEVIQRLEEIFRLMGPYHNRQEVEFLKPVISRVHNICERKGMIEPAPKELNGRKIDVVYSSLVALAAKKGISDNIIRGLQVMQPFAAIDAGALDNIDADDAIRSIGQVYFPTSMVRDQDDVNKIRADRAKQQEQAKNLAVNQANAETVSKVAPAVAKVQESQAV